MALSGWLQKSGMIRRVRATNSLMGRSFSSLTLTQNGKCNIVIKCGAAQPRRSMFQSFYVDARLSGVDLGTALCWKEPKESPMTKIVHCIRHGQSTFNAHWAEHG